MGGSWSSTTTAYAAHSPPRAPLSSSIRAAIPVTTVGGRRGRSPGRWRDGFPSSAPRPILAAGRCPLIPGSGRSMPTSAVVNKLRGGPFHVAVTGDLFTDQRQPAPVRSRAPRRAYRATPCLQRRPVSDQQLERLGVRELRAGRFHRIHPEFAQRQQQAPLFFGRKVSVLHRDEEPRARDVRGQRAIDAVRRPARFDEDAEQLLRAVLTTWAIGAP